MIAALFPLLFGNEFDKESLDSRAWFSKAASSLLHRTSFHSFIYKSDPLMKLAYMYGLLED